jgi:hypothetical protein
VEGVPVPVVLPVPIQSNKCVRSPPPPRVPTRIVQSDLDPGSRRPHVSLPHVSFFIHRTEKEKQQNSNRFGLQWQPEGLRSGHPIARLSDVRVSVPARFRGPPPMTTRPLRCSMLHASAGNVGMGGTSQVDNKDLIASPVTNPPSDTSRLHAHPPIMFQSRQPSHLLRSTRVYHVCTIRHLGNSTMAPTQAYSLFGPNSPFWTASRNSVTSAYRTYNHTNAPM